MLELKPTAMRSVERDDGATFVSTFKTSPPCDANGNPAQYILKLRTTPGPATT